MLAAVTMRQQQWMATTRVATAAAAGRLHLSSSAASQQQRTGVAVVRISSGGVATPARAWGSVRPLCMLATGESRSRLPASSLAALQAQQPLSHRSFANVPPARPSTSTPRPAAGRSASAGIGSGAGGSSSGPASFGATVAPPRLVFELHPPNTVRTKTLLNSVQALFWVGIYGAHFAVPEVVPLWYGALGLTTSLAFGIAMHFRAVRTINELAIYSDNQTYRLGVSDALGRPVFYDAPLKDIGPNPKPKRDGSQRYWTFKVANRPGFFLMERDGGVVYDLFQTNRLLGYDVLDTVKNPADVNVWARERQEAAAREVAATSAPKPATMAATQTVQPAQQQQQPQTSRKGRK